MTELHYTMTVHSRLELSRSTSTEAVFVKSIRDFGCMQKWFFNDRGVATALNTLELEGAPQA